MSEHLASMQPVAMPFTISTAFFFVQVTHGDVIKEEERRSALHHDVIDAHGHEIQPDGIVFIEHEGNLELGTDAIG